MAPGPRAHQSQPIIRPPVPETTVRQVASAPHMPVNERKVTSGKVLSAFQQVHVGLHSFMRGKNAMQPKPSQPRPMPTPMSHINGAGALLHNDFNTFLAAKAITAPNDMLSQQKPSSQQPLAPGCGSSSGAAPALDLHCHDVAQQSKIAEKIDKKNLPGQTPASATQVGPPDAKAKQKRQKPILPPRTVKTRQDTRKQSQYKPM